MVFYLLRPLHWMDANASVADEIQLKYYFHTLHAAPAQPGLALVFGVLSVLAFVGNFFLFVYIILRRLYHNYISSHFIAHLCLTNVVCVLVVLPMFIYTVWTGRNIWEHSNFMCRMQAFAVCTVWTVMYCMVLCIAGVHMLTFVRIHYDQLFGLKPLQLCVLSWVVSCMIALPLATNGHIVVYNPSMRHCIWGLSDSGLKFLFYTLILGIIVPTGFSTYAYLRVLAILYHSPIVFQSIGLYKSRYVVFAFLLSPLYQVPFYVIALTGLWSDSLDSAWPIVCMWFAYTQCLVTPVLYGASLKLITEEDMALTARAHKAVPYAHPHANAAAAVAQRLQTGRLI